MARQEIKLLIVEDDPHVSKALELFFKAEGYSVTVARNGKDALGLLKGGKLVPQIIIADVMMPEMDGFQLCEAVRKESSLQGLSFLFLTALSQPDDRMKGYMAGADDYMSKPFRMEDLSLKVKTLLDIQFKRRPQAIYCAPLKGIATWMLPQENASVPRCINREQCSTAERTKACPFLKAYPTAA